MRKYFSFSVLALIACFVFAAKTVSARRISSSDDVTSSDGCHWHISGWLDLEGQWGWPPVTIHHYDITMSGPCGSHHFQGRVASGGKGKEDQVSIEGTLTEGKSGREEEIASASFLLPTLEALEYVLMKKGDE